MIITVITFLSLFFLEAFATSKNLSKFEFMKIIENIFQLPINCEKQFLELKSIKDINYWTSSCVLNPLIQFLEKENNSIEFDSFIVELSDYNIVNCNTTDFLIYQNEFTYPYCVTQEKISSFEKRMNSFELFGITKEVISDDFYLKSSINNLFANNLRLENSDIFNFTSIDDIKNLNELIQFSLKYYDDQSAGISNFNYGFKTKIQSKMIDYYKEIYGIQTQTRQQLNSEEFYFNPINKENVNLILPTTKNFQYRIFFYSNDMKLFCSYNILGSSDEVGHMDVYVNKRIITNPYFKEDFESKERWVEKNQLYENYLVINIMKWSRIVLFFVIGIEIAFLDYYHKCASIKALKIIFSLAVMMTIFNLSYSIYSEFSAGIDLISDSPYSKWIGSVFDTFYYNEFNIEIFNIFTMIIMVYFLIM